MKRLSSILCSLAVLLCACATTSVKNTWKSPDCQGPVGKIAVLAVTERGLLRQGFENRFVAQLAKTGSSGATTFAELSLPEIKQNKRAAADRLGAGGAEALLILRLVDSSSSYHESRGRERYAPVITGYDNLGWYDFYNVAFMDMGVSYGSVEEKVYLESCLYDLKNEKRLWSGITRTILRDNTDRVAEMDPLVEKVVNAMRKDGVVR